MKKTSKHNHGNRPLNHKAAWNCDHCHATNFTNFCGCGDSRKDRGDKNQTVDINSIELTW